MVASGDDVSMVTAKCVLRIVNCALEMSACFEDGTEVCAGVCAASREGLRRRSSYIRPCSLIVDKNSIGYS